MKPSGWDSYWNPRVAKMVEKHAGEAIPLIVKGS